MFDPEAVSTPLLLLGIAFSLGVVLGLRRLAPARPGLALFLAVLFGPAGHLYLKGGARYILLMYAAWLGLLIATPLPVMISGLLLTVLSVLLMNARIRGSGKTA